MTELETPAEFDRKSALRNIRHSSPNAKIFELSARSGEGFPAWCDDLVALKKRWLESAWKIELPFISGKISTNRETSQIN